MVSTESRIAPLTVIPRMRPCAGVGITSHSTRFSTDSTNKSSLVFRLRDADLTRRVPLHFAASAAASQRDHATTPEALP